MNRILPYIAVILALAAGLLMVYGIYSFPDAPIRRCGDDCYQNKQGQVKTQVDYEAFNRWLTVTPILVALAIGTGLTASYIEKRRRPSPA